MLPSPLPLSRDCKLMSGITLLTVPTIVYGGLTLLGLLTGGTAGLAPRELGLDDTGYALWRAGHAHAGVWLILSLVVQVLLDATRLSAPWRWTARVAAPLAAVLTPAGFFGLAFVPAFRWLVHAGWLCLVAAVLVTGVGLLRNLGRG